MKNTVKLFGIIALVAIIGLSMTGCVSTSINGTADPHGLFTGFGARKSVSEGAEEIASYSVILGLFDIGHKDYVEKVKAAEKAGKKIRSSSMAILGFFTSVKAYAE